MIVAQARNEAAVIGHTLEEHLLERISILEYSLLRSTERLERILDLIERLAENSSYDHNFLQSLVAVLTRKGALETDEVGNAMKARLARQLAQSSEREQLESLRQTCLGSFRGRRPELFGRLLEDGVTALRQAQRDQGGRLLEQALKLDPRNQPLALFLGQFYFRYARIVEARRHLTRVLRREPTNFTAALLLGIGAADEGKHRQAEKYLRSALDVRADSYAAHYGLGRVLIERGQTELALSHFKRALLLKPSPDLYYLVGRVYFEQGKVNSAQRHWQRALALDPQFDAALYHLGLVYLQRNCVDKAKEHFRAALELKPGESRYRAAVRARVSTALKPFPVLDINRGQAEDGEFSLLEAVVEDLNLRPFAQFDESEK